MSQILITYIVTVHLLEYGASYHPVPLGELHIAATYVWCQSYCAWVATTLDQ